jgi:hypothetical protein
MSRERRGALLVLVAALSAIVVMLWVGWGALLEPTDADDTSERTGQVEDEGLDP